MPMITKHNRVLALMGLDHPGKFESAPRRQTRDILQARLRNKKQKTKTKKKKSADLIIGMHKTRNSYDSNRAYFMWKIMHCPPSRYRHN